MKLLTKKLLFILEIPESISTPELKPRPREVIEMNEMRNGNVNMKILRFACILFSFNSI